ncbi:hypothetical protein SeH_A3024 [Salmonella enterica subsp. enterica serovar Hadar str. RI_05P066]|nr:hypothetical protein SNSL317_A1073 [Salmonella enterica subsp. enterica serovar Newport str. SL317]EDZ36273.1 hypothetical protein SeH_A3024 [Salmonella enterica subsp. enterica serovar Hadar str. RI_05P066]
MRLNLNALQEPAIVSMQCFTVNVYSKVTCGSALSARINAKITTVEGE